MDLILFKVSDFGISVSDTSFAPVVSGIWFPFVSVQNKSKSNLRNVARCGMSVG